MPIQPVSYAVKPKQDEPAPAEASTPQDAQPQPPQPRTQWEEAPGLRSRSAWSQEDLRYIKDAGSTIAPVSYPARVAPLPEDKALDEEKSEQTGTERRPIEEVSRVAGMRRRMATRMFVEEEKDTAPFPSLIKVVKNERKPVHDLAEAIRLVKVLYLLRLFTC